MGGKKITKQQDKLAKANASSSARAVQYLGNSGATSGFIGFSAFAAAPAPAPTEASVSTPSSSATFSFYDGADGDLSLALKMLGKRDALTKTKALLSLKDAIVPGRKPLELRPAVGHYCYLYGKLMAENDRRVRQLSNEVLLALLEKMKKATVFHQHMALLLPTWYILAMQDSHVETARVAARSFQILFPTPPDQQAVLTTHAELLVTSIRQYLVAKVDDLSDRDLYSADEAEERYERILTSALLGLGKLVETLAPVADAQSHLAPDGLLYHLLTSPALTRHTAATSKSATFSRASVRLGAYKALTAVVSHTTIPLEAKAVLGVFQEKTPGNHDAMWSLVLSFVKRTPDLPWAALQSSVVPRLLALIKHGFYGSGATSYPNLLPLVAAVPFAVGADVLYAPLLQALWKGLDTPHVLQAEADVVAAFLECLTAMVTIFVALPPGTDADKAALVAAFDPAAYVARTFDGVLHTVLASLLHASLSDRAFAAVVKHLFQLPPRVQLFREGRSALAEAAADDATKTKWIALVLAVQDAFLRIFHDALGSALVSGIEKQLASTAFLPERLVGLLAQAKATYLKQSDGALYAAHIVPLAQRVYAAVLASIDVAHPLARQFLVLAQLLDVFGIDAGVGADAATLRAQYETTLAPALAHLQPPTDFFKLFRHYVQAVPDGREAMWRELTRRMDAMDDPLAAAIAARSLALKSADASAAEWLAGEAPPAALWGVLWRSQWFDRHVNSLLIAGAARDWTATETLFLASCWADGGVPVIAKATLDAAVLYCDRFHATQTDNVLAVLESLLPHVERTPTAVALVLHVVRAMHAANPTTAHTATCLWSERLRPRIQAFWSSDSKAKLVAAWADALNAAFATEEPPAWAAFAGAYLALDVVCGEAPAALWSRLSALATPSYRQLELLAELCHYDASALVRGVTLDALLQWVYLDVGFALTWFAVDGAHVAPVDMVTAGASSHWLDNYLLLGPLYEAPVVGALLPRALALAPHEAAPWLQCVLTTHIDNPALKSSVVLAASTTPDGTFVLEALVQVLVDALPPAQVTTTLTPTLLENHPTYAPRLVRRGVVDAEATVTVVAGLEARPFDALAGSGPLLAAVLAADAMAVAGVDGLVATWTQLLATSGLPRPLAPSEWATLCDVAVVVIGAGRPGALGLATQLLSAAFAAKLDQSAIVALKLHTARTDGSGDVPWLRAQLLRLVQAVALAGHDHLDLELARPLRDAVLHTALRAVADGLAVRPQVQAAFVGCNDLGACVQLVVAAVAADRAVATGLLAMADVVSFVDLPPEGLAGAVLQAFDGRDALWAALTHYGAHPVLQGVVYGLLRLTALAVTTDAHDTGVDVDADDEAATEAALVGVLISPGLATALATVTAAPATPAEALAQFLLWDLYLRMFPDGGSPLVTSALGAFVRPQLPLLLLSCGPYLKNVTLSEGAIEPAFPTLAPRDHSAPGLLAPLAGALFYRTVVKLPTMVRLWWNDECSRSARSWVAKFCEENVSPLLLQEEIAAIHAAAEKDLWDPEEMNVRGSKVSREVVTSYIKDECSLEMVVRVPASYPLRSVEVECTKRIGISEERWRRWVLQIIKVTSSQDGSLLDAVLLWKSNVDREFDGVDPCPICYSILNPKTMGLPNLSCKTCKNKYHNSCLYKWFNQSSKNKCPICQQPFC
ncbi:hypothetical protein ACHHYP_12304 [Achlya hypogyna]|uniref:E3 ubiquitin-protein ligase listerin n=1 Tax=Achlya hypogyna TaxID=1202772 RepID=A0A1V9ZGZ7_ACHHY|nr:hypothetical protein ACHHYP_12304 [Achlya hypogyna]